MRSSNPQSPSWALLCLSPISDRRLCHPHPVCGFATLLLSGFRLPVRVWFIPIGRLQSAPTNVSRRAREQAREARGCPIWSRVGGRLVQCSHGPVIARWYETGSHLWYRRGTVIGFCEIFCNWLLTFPIDGVSFIPTDEVHEQECSMPSGTHNSAVILSPAHYEEWIEECSNRIFIIRHLIVGIPLSVKLSQITIWLREAKAELALGEESNYWRLLHHVHRSLMHFEVDLGEFESLTLN